MGTSRGETALAWWDSLLISVRGWDNLISGNIWTLVMAPC